MTGAEILDLIMGRCNRTSPEFRANVLKEMNLVQTDRLEKRGTLPHWLIQERSDAETEIDEPRLFLPVDFLREVEDMNLVWVSDDEGEVPMEKVSWDYGLLQYAETDTGPPDIYTMRGEYIHIRPIPDAIYIVRFSGYYAKQPLVIDDATFENKWTINAPNLLLSTTGIVMASQYIKDPDLTNSFGILMKDANKELEDSLTAFEEANRSRRMG